MTHQKTLAIIGAGPVGLAAAAHALARGLRPVLLEQGPAVGHAIRQWAHVPMFSPWGFNRDGEAARLLDGEGWQRPDPARYPTGGELVGDYLEPLATLLARRAELRLGARVVAVSRLGFDKVRTAGRAQTPFVLHYRDRAGAGSVVADAVIDASGTWSSPNPAGLDGLPVPGEIEAAARIRHGMPDVQGTERVRYAGRRVAVLGGGHSAIGTLIALAELQRAAPATEATWLYRGANLAKAFGGGAADQLSARGELGLRIAELVESGRLVARTGFSLAAIERAGAALSLLPRSPAREAIEVDELVVATGFRPELDLLRELRIALDPALECPPALAPLIDPNEHSCGTVRPHGAAELAQPEPGFYIAGMKSYGRAPTFLLATGHEQARSIVAEIAGDHEAARRVELVLPETGVCSTVPGGASASCCGGPAPAESQACCRDDADARAAGQSGCGCGTSRSEPRETADA